VLKSIDPPSPRRRIAVALTLCSLSLINATPSAAVPVANAQQEPSVDAVAGNTLGAPLFVANLRMESESLDFPRLVPVVQIRINGSKPLFFMVDTGAPRGLHLFPWAIRELKLGRAEDPAESGGAQRLLVDRVALIGKASGAEHVLTGISANPLASGMSPAAQAPGLAGILGSELFAQYVVRIDPAAKTLSLYAPSEKTAVIPGATQVTLLPSTLTGDTARRDVEALLPGAGKVRMLLDTGSEHVQILATVASRLTGLRLDPKPRALEAANGRIVSYSAMLGEVRLGSGVVTSPLVTLVRGEEREVPRLGMPILSRFRMTVDYAHNRMQLEPVAESGRSARIPADIGLVITREGRQFVAGTLKSGGAAQRAGILTGDIVTALDDSPLDTSNITAEAVNGLLPKRAGQSVRLTVRRRDGKTGTAGIQVVTVRAEDPYVPVESGTSLLSLLSWRL
jgi:predicted aspartyl protease